MPAGSHKDTEEHKQLKIKARALGLKFGPRLAYDKLVKLVDDHEKGIDNTMEAVVDTPVRKAMPPKFQGKTYVTEAEYKRKQIASSKANAGRLVRCRITCMNPHKKNWTGEIISVGSSKLGTYKKFIPFNSEEPYHIPYIIYKAMKERQCRIGTTQKLPNGHEVNRNKLINEFAIELLDPLTPEELKELAQRQAMASGTATVN